MNEIYIVTISFEDFESSSWVEAGFFSSEEEAKEVKEKWKTFFEENQNKIFNIPRCVDGEFESDEAEDEHYSRLAKYEQLHSYSGISIEKRRFGVDDFASKSESRSKEMQNLVQQWEREYRINKIIE